MYYIFAKLCGSCPFHPLHVYGNESKNKWFELNWIQLVESILLKFLQKISFIGLNPGPGLLSFLQVFQISFSMSSQKISSFDRKSLNGNWEQNRILWCIQNILLSSSLNFILSKVVYMGKLKVPPANPGT